MSKKHNKFNNPNCDNKMSFDECELAIMRQIVDEIEAVKPDVNINSPEITKIIGILERFLIRKQLICYGGTAINNILPKDAQFYDKQTEIPDYDFYSFEPMDDAIELADIYNRAGYEDVEAKAGVHHGTYKVFVNFIGIADITYLPQQLFAEIKKDAKTVAGILYAPAIFLRMNMFLELSRPKGDVSRWEKVLKRLTLLNKHYPLKTETDCMSKAFQRQLTTNYKDSERLYTLVRDTFVDLEVVFFGGYASALYSHYMPDHQRHLVKKIPDFDVLCEDPDKAAFVICSTLTNNGFLDVIAIENEPIGEIIPRHIEIRVGKETLAFIYLPSSCHSYNTISVDKRDIRVATIETMLTFYLAFYYVNDPNKYDRDRIICMAKFLFDVEQKNRMEQKGVLKRFTMDCYGKQDTLDDIRNTKTAKYKELKNKRGTLEYDEWFLKYEPAKGNRPKYFKPIKYTLTLSKTRKSNTGANPSKTKPPSLSKTQNQSISISISPKVKGRRKNNEPVKPKKKRKTQKKRVRKESSYLF